MLDTIERRRSIRQYSRAGVSEEDVQRLLQAAMAAPSARAQDPWHFIVVRDAETRSLLAATHGFSGMCAQSPVVIVVCGDAALSEHWVSDCSAATQNILLAATALGLGSCWVATYPRPEREAHLRSVLGLPANIKPLCMIPIGHPAEEKPARSRYSADKVHHQRW